MRVRLLERRGRAHALDRLLASVALFVPLGLIGVVNRAAGASLLGTVLFAFLVAKLLIARMAHSRRPTVPSTEPSLRVRVIMPLHNEDPAFVVAAVRSLLAQSRPAEHIHVIDDGSTDGGAAAAAVAAELSQHLDRGRWTLTRLPENRGKRYALSVGFCFADRADIFLCVDSDTVVDSRAIERGIRPFSDDRTTAVAGVVTAHNWSRGVLTRLIDLRYMSAFLAERAAYSFFGSVLCCCGSLAFYRADVVRENLADFLDQRFLGKAATYGDDRRLTNYALRAGRVVLCPDARASTAVPERLGHYARQQVRWNKSFIRESIWVLATFPFSAGAFWLTLYEVLTWVVVTSLFLVTLAVLPFAGSRGSLLPFVGLIALAAYARNAVYLHDVRPQVSRRDRLTNYAMAPLYGVLHLFVLTPLRLWAFLTLRRTGWGTRHQVEVRYAPNS